MKTLLTIIVLLSTCSGYMIKISENLSTQNCQEVLNNLEVCYLTIFKHSSQFLLYYCLH